MIVLVSVMVASWKGLLFIVVDRDTCFDNLVSKVIFRVKVCCIVLVDDWLIKLPCYWSFLSYAFLLAIKTLNVIVSQNLSFRRSVLLGHLIAGVLLVFVNVGCEV